MRMTVATHLESQIQAHTNILQILVLQRSFSNLDSPLLVPGRRLLKSGPLRKLDRRGTDQDRNFFLFNDILVHASGGAPGPASTADATGEAPYWMHRKIKLEEITVVEIQDATEEGRRFGFEIRSREKSFALFAGTYSILRLEVILMGLSRYSGRQTRMDPSHPQSHRRPHARSQDPPARRRLRAPTSSAQGTTHLDACHRRRLHGPSSLPPHPLQSRHSSIRPCPSHTLDITRAGLRRIAHAHVISVDSERLRSRIRFLDRSPTYTLPSPYPCDLPSQYHSPQRLPEPCFHPRDPIVRNRRRAASDR